MDTKHPKNTIKKNVMLLLILLQLISAKGSMVQAKEVEETKNSWNLFNLAPVSLLKSNVAQAELVSEESVTPEIDQLDISENGDNSVRATLIDGVLTIEGTGRMQEWDSYQNTPWGSDDIRTTIKSVEIYDGVTNIGAYAFGNGVNIENITIPKTVTSIGRAALFNCSKLTNIEIPNKVANIGEYAFETCRKITSIYIPDSVTTIGKMAFWDMRALTEINVSDLNNNYSSNDGVLFDKNKENLICYPNGKSGKFYSIPTGVDKIDYGGLCLSDLETIIIPEGTKEILIPDSFCNAVKSSHKL